MQTKLNIQKLEKGQEQSMSLDLFAIQLENSCSSKGLLFSFLIVSNIFVLNVQNISGFSAVHFQSSKELHFQVLICWKALNFVGRHQLS